MRTKEREAAYAAIDGEREYQDWRWGKTLSSGIPGAGERSIDEFALYIVNYVNLLVHECTTGHTTAKLSEMRKVAALAVACLEQHGTIPRVFIRPPPAQS